MQVEYDPRVIQFKQLLDVFWSSHDSRQVFGQGPDVGDQYRSIIFTNRTQEARLAAVSKEREQAKSRSSLVTTEIQQLGVFYPAEAEHQVFLSFLNDIGGQIAVRAIWSSPSAFIWNALLTLPYLVQKFELKRNRFLLQLIGNMPDEELTTSSLAAKLNGYAAELCPTIIQRKIDAKIDEIVKNGWPVLREI
ncbi:hypothetical protein GW17_00003929 [Ensete ventricosum]|nr:hypothetical protein GW17_00003929 [Ensete ventricosum]RZS13913.1 hypothetical protein BHM03_00045548 [Ensete ventricosum]